MASLNEVPDLAGDVDYYAWLGLSNSASKEEINRAYKNLSRIFHPDKHQGSERKQQASAQFNKIKRAYEVLTDPLRKAIYDTAGVEGLEMEGWQVQERYKSSKEILEEMERMKLEEEEKKLRQCTNAKGSMTVGINATDIFDNYEYNIDYPSVFPTIEVSEAQIRQSVECPLTRQDTLLLAGCLSAKNGKGSTDVALTFRKVLNDKLTGETEVHLGSKTSFGFSCFRSLWRNGSGNMGLQFQLAPDGSFVPFYSLNFTHQFDKHIQGRLAFMAGVQSGVNTSLVHVTGAHITVIGCQVGVPISFVHAQYSYDFKKRDCKLKLAGKFSTMGWSIDYQCSKKITKFSTLSAAVSVGAPSGVVLKIGLSRGQQVFSIPIYLSEALEPSAVFYATTLPLLLYVVVKKMLVEPYVDKLLQKDLKLQKQKHAELLSMRRQEAADAMDLMAEMIGRSYEVEEAVGGLVLEEALYGRRVMQKSISECIEVARCLQALVKNSTLTISPHTKLHSLPGFFDPCFGEKKELLIRYSYQRSPHMHLFQEGDLIRLPDDEHRCTGQ